MEQFLHADKINSLAVNVHAEYLNNNQNKVLWEAKVVGSDLVQKFEWRAIASWFPRDTYLVVFPNYSGPMWT